MKNKQTNKFGHPSICDNHIFMMIMMMKNDRLLYDNQVERARKTDEINDKDR